jgi:hypothetical protein
MVCEYNKHVATKDVCYLHDGGTDFDVYIKYLSTTGLCGVANCGESKKVNIRELSGKCGESGKSHNVV